MGNRTEQWLSIRLEPPLNEDEKAPQDDVSSGAESLTETIQIADWPKIES
jgi:hypothetical protein